MTTAALPPQSADDFEDEAFVGGSQDAESPPDVRPQILVLMFCGAYLTAPGSAVSTVGLINVLARVGVGEHAARSTVNRMVSRETLQRQRIGKQIYLLPSPQARSMLAEGGVRAWRSPVNRTWDGQWTMLGFSLPESRRADRHLLRSRLQWAGFGMLQNGLWVAARDVDVAALLDQLDVLQHLKVFRARVAPPTQVAELIEDAWELPTIASGYREFLDRWDRPDPLPEAADDLARQLWLLGEWTVLARRDPGLPVEYLPADWPAVRAEHVALRLRTRFEAGAGAIANRLIERVDLAD